MFVRRIPSAANTVVACRCRRQYDLHFEHRAAGLNRTAATVHSRNIADGSLRLVEVPMDERTPPRDDIELVRVADNTVLDRADLTTSPVADAFSGGGAWFGTYVALTNGLVPGGATHPPMSLTLVDTTGERIQFVDHWPLDRDQIVPNAVVSDPVIVSANEVDATVHFPWGEMDQVRCHRRSPDCYGS